MNEIPRKADGKIITEGSSFSANESIRGKIDLRYYDDMTRQKYSLRFRCFTRGNFQLGETNKLTSMRNPKRRFTDTIGKPINIAKVGPMYDYDPKTKDVEMANYFLREEKINNQPKKKLNRIDFVVKETTNEGDNLIISLRAQKRMPLRDLFHSTIAEIDINLVGALEDELCLSDKDPVSLRFEIKLNDKVPASFQRPIDLVSNPDFDQKREEMIQTTVYKRSKTLVQANANAPQDEIEKALQSETISVVSVLELYCEDRIINSCEVSIVEGHSIFQDNLSKMITGSVPRTVRFLCCLKKRSYLNFVFCLVDNQINERKQGLTFKLKAQNGLVKYHQYLDFKLKERIEKGGNCYIDRTIQGYSVYLAKKQSRLASKSDSEYFEVLGSVVLDGLNVGQHFSLLTSPIKISHRLKVYLSNWPYTFTRLVGEVEVRISRTGTLSTQLEIFPDVFSFLTLTNSEPQIQCSL